MNADTQDEKTGSNNKCATQTVVEKCTMIT